MAADKKLALELLINVQTGNLTLEELNEQIAEAKKQLADMGDEGSEDFVQLSEAIQTAEESLGDLNPSVEKLNKNLDATKDVAESVSKQLTNAQSRYKQLSSVIEEQKDILIEFKKELAEAQRIEAAGDKGKLGRQKILQDRVQQLKDAISDQRVSLQELNNERSKEKQTIKELTKASVDYRKLIRGIDKLTGGMATKVVKLYKGFKEGTKLIKGFIAGLNGFQKALIGTGIGAFVVALGVVAAYWDEIVDFIDGGNKKLEKQLAQNQKQSEELEHQLSLLELEEQILEKQGLNTSNIVAEKKKIIVLQQEENRQELELLKTKQKKLIEQAKEPALWLKLAGAVLGYKAQVGKITEEEKEAIEANNKRIDEAEKNAKKLELELLKIDENKKKKDTKAANDAKKAQEKADKEAERLAEEKEKALEEIRKGGISTRQEELDEELLQIDRYYQDLIEKAEKYNEDTAALEEAREAKKAEVFENEKKRQEEEEKRKAKQLLQDQENRIEELEKQKVVDEENFSERRAEIERREKLILEDKIITEEQKKVLLQATAEEEKKLDEDVLENKQTIESTKLQLAQNVFTGISNLTSLFAKEDEESAKKQFELNKALSIGQTIIATYEGAQNAYRTAQKSPLTAVFPAFPAVQAGLAVAAGLAQVKKIKSTQFKSDSVDRTRPQIGGGVLGGQNVGFQPRTFESPIVDTQVQTTKVIVTETDIRNVSRNVDGVYSRATVVQ